MTVREIEGSGETGLDPMATSLPSASEIKGGEAIPAAAPKKDPPASPGFDPQPGNQTTLDKVDP